MNARTPSTALLAAPLVLLLACVDDVGSGRVAAEVVEAPAPAAPVEGRSVAVDTSQSRIHALGAKVTKTHDIVFDDWSGALTLSGDQVVGVEATVQMNSLRADVDDLTGHLKSPDFFEVETWPTASFVSSQVDAQSGPDGSTHLVAGALTMHGTTQTLRFPATIANDGGQVSMDAEFVIDRREFGIVYPGMPDDLIQDNVVLTIALVADAS